jgi:AcrR family transcriptional regulator
MTDAKDSTGDGRHRRGNRTRAAVAVRAAERASVDGLAGVSLSQIAADLRISKGGIQAVYRSKEELQVAAIAAASEIFMRQVVMPAIGAPAGLQRLWALIDAWLSYVEHRVFPGGCFMASTVPEFDSRPGPVRDALAEARRGWLGLLEREVRHAQTRAELADDVPADLLAFEIDAVLTMANTACNLADQPAPLHTARALLEVRLAPPITSARPRAGTPDTPGTTRRGAKRRSRLVAR